MCKKLISLFQLCSINHINVNIKTRVLINVIVETTDKLIQINKGVYPNIKRDCTCISVQ